MNDIENEDVLTFEIGPTEENSEVKIIHNDQVDLIENNHAVDPISGLDPSKYPNLNSIYNQDGLIGIFKQRI